MAITLVMHKKIPLTEWKIHVHDTKKGNGYIEINASVTHLRTRKDSCEFTVKHYNDSDQIKITSDGFSWDSTINKTDGKPESIIRECLKKPIIVSVMYRVGTNMVMQTRKMNKFFGCRVFHDTDER